MLKKLLSIAIVVTLSSKIVAFGTNIETSNISIKSENGNVKIIVNGKAVAYDNTNIGTVYSTVITNGKVYLNGKEIDLTENANLSDAAKLKALLHEKQERVLAVTQALQKTMKACENKSLEDKKCNQAYRDYQRAVEFLNAFVLPHSK